MLHIAASGWIILTHLQSAASRPTEDDAKILPKNSILWVKVHQCHRQTTDRLTDWFVTI